MKTAIITDSVAYLSDDMQRHPDIFVIPIPINHPSGRHFEDSAKLSDLKKFLDEIEKEEVLPTTAQPAPGEYLTLLQELVNQGYEQIFAVHLSSGISGLYESACSYAQEFSDQLDIYVIDSKGATVAMELIIERIFYMVNDKGLDGQEVAQKAQQMADGMDIYLMVENMDNLVKGGRLNKRIAQIGGALKVRPILYFDDAGEITLFETVRTTKKVYKRWIQLAKEAVSQYPDHLTIGVAHADNEEAALELADKIRTEIPEYQGEIRIGLLGPVVSIYTGRKALGIGLVPLVD